MPSCLSRNSTTAAYSSSSAPQTLTMTAVPARRSLGRTLAAKASTPTPWRPMALMRPLGRLDEARRGIALARPEVETLDDEPAELLQVEVGLELEAVAEGAAGREDGVAELEEAQVRREVDRRLLHGHRMRSPGKTGPSSQILTQPSPFSVLDPVDAAPAGADAAAHDGLEGELGRDAELRGERGQGLHHRVGAAGVDDGRLGLGHLPAGERGDEAGEAEAAVVGRTAELEPGLLELVAERDVGDRPAAVEDDGPRPGRGELAGQEEERGDAPAAADEIGRLSLHRGGDGEALAERADEVERGRPASSATGSRCPSRRS